MRNLIYFLALALTAAEIVSANGLNHTLFADSTMTPSPAVIAAAPTGEVFVGVDRQGSLGKQVGLGKIVRLVDNDHDGKADTVTEFATLNNPRGITVLGDRVIVLHTTIKDGQYNNQQLSVLYDKNRDGVADGPAEPLVRNIGNSALLKLRGVDHATNNIRYGIDGWIYISVGDFGMVNAQGTDGNKLTMHGGVARVRPDGTGLELVVENTRNVYDVAIDPEMNLFTRENSNDGVGWWTRASHFIQSADYGYPHLYTNFPEDMLPAMGEYGSGAGAGALFLDEPQWPQNYNNTALLADWGHSKIYSHELTSLGATFSNKVKEFASISQVTDLDVDGSGRLYVAAWDGAGYQGNVNKGFIETVVPEGWRYKPFPVLVNLDVEGLIDLLKSNSHTARTHASYELLNRDSSTAAEAVLRCATDSANSKRSRIAALYTYTQIKGVAALPALEKLVRDEVIREYAIRAMADDLSIAKSANLSVIADYLHDTNPRVQAAAIIALGRSGNKTIAGKLLPLAAPQVVLTEESKKQTEIITKITGEPGYISPDVRNPHSTPNAGGVIPHLAQKALVALDAKDEIADAILRSTGDAYYGALATAKFMHADKIVSALITKVENASKEIQMEIMTVLARLHQQEKPYDGTTWWGTRPDPDGPYNLPVDWESTTLINQFFLSEIPHQHDQAVVVNLLKKNKAYVPIYNPRPKKTGHRKNRKVSTTSIEDVVLYMADYKAKVENGAKVITEVGCAGCHNIDTTDVVKGPDLTKLGKMSVTDLSEAIIKPWATIADTWVTLTTKAGVPHIGTIVNENETTISLHNLAGDATTLERSEIHTQEPGLNVMSHHLTDDLTLDEFGDLLAYIKSLDKNN